MRNQTLPQGCCVPSWFTLQCRVLTSSQASSYQREKLSSAPLSFNIPNTSAWNNCTNTSHCLLLACCLVCLSYLLPWNLTSPHCSSEPFCYCIDTHDCCQLYGESGTNRRDQSMSSELTSLFSFFKCRNWYPSSSTYQRCLSTAMATIWGWGKMEPRFVTWNCRPGPRNLRTSSGSTGW